MDSMDVDNNERISKLNNTDSIILETIDNFLMRGAIGYNKYGTTMDRNDITVIEWINHAIEEQMDNILYLTKLKKELVNLKK